MTDRELLAELFNFLRQRTFITADKESVKDMCTRYQNPPMTLRNLAAMQMTMAEYRRLNELLKQIGEYLETTEHA